MVTSLWDETGQTQEAEMAQVVNNIFARGLSGKLGDQVVFRHLRDGRTIVCTKPDFSRRKLSREQKEHHKRFKQAAAYAQSAAHSQPIYAERAAGTLKNAYNVAVGDWFHPPVIHRLERNGEAIRIEASDDVLVAGVRVVVLDEQGKTVEKGEAVKRKDNWWEYVPQESGKVTVEARDLAGNKVQAELERS
jgi:hypothetical protein